MSTGPRGLAAVFAAAAVVSLWLLVRGRRGQTESYIDDRESNATHLLMNATMAVMVTPLCTSVTETVIRSLYWLAAAILGFLTAVKLTRSTARAAGRAPKLGGSIYHLFAVGLMIYALRLMPSGMTAGMRMVPADRGHSWLAWLFGLLFLLDASASSLLVLFFPRRLLDMADGLAGAKPARSQAARPENRRISSLKQALFPHVIMDVGMAYMLVIM